MSYLFTSESVSEGHPDKVADQISDAILDEMLKQDANSRVACETLVTTGQVVVAGEVTTNAWVNIPDVVRQVIREIGYTKAEYMFEAHSCGVLTALHSQSADIARGVNSGKKKKQGAGDQGMMFGYATNETPEYMPMAIMFSHQLVKKLADIRKSNPKLMPYLRPDAKSQVTVEYNGRRPVRVHTVVISTQHDGNVSQDRIKRDVIKYVVNAVIPEHLRDRNLIVHVNPTGKFEIGGP
ncbi:methionine adenosyltransferase, partial [Sphingobacteriales bacterium CHB3]|nr:methionine adenosyltransferase [Sphingobacteriales bacterium CHB3]